MGRGVSHCASCDGPLYNGQTVGVSAAATRRFKKR